jgi:hypothetical protein
LQTCALHRKIFEKLILKRILYENSVDITGTNQHGFKKGKSTSSRLSIELQSMIATALNSDEYVKISSLELSSKFDLVDIKLLKRLKIIVLPDDVVVLIREWLVWTDFTMWI